MSPQNFEDDYYAKLGSNSSSESDPESKLVKKKLKVKPKKIEETVTVQTLVEKEENPVQEEEETFVAPIVFEEESEKEEVKKPTFQVVHSSWDKDEKSAVKFKPGFSKSVKPLHTQKKVFDGKEEARRPKLGLYDKNQKHKKISLDDENTGFVRSGKMKHKKKEEKRVEDMVQNLTTRTGETVILGDVVSLKEFSEKIGISIVKLIAEFMKNGMIVNINSQIDFDTASLIADTFEVKIQKDTSAGVGVDDLIQGNIRDFLKEDDTALLVSRSPVVSIMGHVDHGKTSLLDQIRKSKVAASEAGGITQSIWAYQVEHNGRNITFLDTPGHEAFTVMRARGAKSTDIAILVVASDEGVKPQTIESISHAKEAGIPVIVAINKMDKESANPDYVKSQLAEHGLTPEDWGGDTPMVPVSALTGFWVEDLLEIILLSADILDLKANPDRAGVATVIESHLDIQLGPVATVLVNTGTIHNTDNIVCADAYGKIKVLRDFMGNKIRFASPGMPILIVWLDRVVEGWDILQAVATPEIAKQKSQEYREVFSRQKQKNASQLDMLMFRIKSGNLKQLKIVVKSDTNGSLEAIKNALLKLSTEETTVSIIHAGVGNITEGDVLMCQGSEALLVAFWVDVVPTAKRALEDAKIEFIQSKIIYHITERVEKIITGMLNTKEVEVILAEAIVWGIFYTSKEFTIVWLQIKTESVIEDKTFVRIIRKDKVVGKGKILSLKQWVEEMKKIEWPTECGIKLQSDIVPELKDIIEIYKITLQK